MKRQSILFKIIIPVISILLISLVSFSIITYIKMGSTLMSQMQQLTSSNLESLKNTIDENEASYELVKSQLYSDLAVKCYAVAEIAKANPSLLSDSYLEDIVKRFGVDGVSIIDEKGLIQYCSDTTSVGYDMNSSDQSKVFMEGITNKDFLLIQEPSVRGSDGALFQYAGVARIDAPGVVQVGVEPETLQKLLESISMDKIINSTTFGKTGEAMVTDAKGVITNHKDTKIVGKNLSDLGIKVDLSKESGELLYRYNGEDRYLQYVKIGDSYLYTMVTHSEFMTPLYETLRTVIIVEVIVFILGMILIIVVIRASILSRFKAIVRLINKTAGFDLASDTSFDYLTRSGDEIGVISKEITSMRAKLREMVENIRGEADNIKLSSNNLAAATAASSVASEEVAKAMGDLATGASEQASQSQRGSSKLMGLSGEIEAIVNNAALMKDFSNEIDRINTGGTTVVKRLQIKYAENMDISGKVAVNIEKLSNQSELVETIVDTIETIAAKTNLLALNAAIEAARAGEAGKGFAVVAEEIRNLAGQTTAATNKISTIVESINGEIGVAKDNMDKASDVVVEGNNDVRATAEMFDHISTSIKSLLQQIEDIEKSIKVMNDNKNGVIDVIQEISAISEESAASTQEVSASVEEQATMIESISETVERLKLISEKLSGTMQNFMV